MLRKATRKNPNERYETAQHFAEDLQRFLDDVPISAKRPGPLQVSAQWARRHTAAVATLVGFLLLTTTATAIAAALLGHERSETRMALAKAEENLEESLHYQRIVVREEEKARTEAAISRAVNQFLNDLLGLANSISQVESGIKPNPDITLKTVLDRAANRVGERFATSRWWRPRSVTRSALRMTGWANMPTQRTT